MVNRTIRDRLVAIAEPKARMAAKVQEVARVLTDVAKGLRIERKDLTVEFQDAPKVILDKAGNVVGIDALVRAYDADGRELQVDPHRICINPPLLVPDGDGFREDPLEAYLTWLEQSIRGVPNAKGWNTRGTVTTVFATAPGGNGYTSSASNAVYAVAVSVGGTAGNNHIVGQSLAGNYVAYESFVEFDTSGIDDGDAVSDVVLSLDGNTDISDTDFDIIAAALDYGGGAVTNADWTVPAVLAGLTTLATWNTAGYSANYNAFTSAGAAFNSAINLTGNTRLILFSAKTQSATAPTGSEAVIFTDADAAGTTTDSKLDITHAAAGGGSGPATGLVSA